jgi:hypothetical protein
MTGSPAWPSGAWWMSAITPTILNGPAPTTFSPSGPMWRPTTPGGGRLRSRPEHAPRERLVHDDHGSVSTRSSLVNVRPEATVARSVSR